MSIAYALSKMVREKRTLVLIRTKGVLEELLLHTEGEQHQALEMKIISLSREIDVLLTDAPLASRGGSSPRFAAAPVPLRALDTRVSL
jgi:hypothetical protein